MKCPVCRNEMVEEDFGGVKVDVCKNECKGLWFDWCELGKLDQENEGLGEALQEALNYPRYNDSRGQLDCPKCGLPMFSHKFEADKEINVDECYKCGGFFVDSGELKIIRDKYMSVEEREAYAEKMVGELPVYEKAIRDLNKEKLRVNAIHRYTKFLQLSYYVTGK